ncbi:Universal stress protein family protein [compost metagenome]
MTIKTLLVSACDDPGREARLNLACDLAQAFDASLIGAGPCVSEPVADDAFAVGAMTGELTTLYRDKAEADVRESQARFEAVAAARGIAGRWVDAVGHPAAVVNAAARAADLVMVAARSPGAPLRAPDPVDVIVGAGRPVLVVPTQPTAPPVGRAAVLAWKDSRESRLAAAAALPLLQASQQTHVVSVCHEEDAAHAAAVLADVQAWLERHEVPTSSQVLVKDETTTGERLLDYAAGLGAGLIVSGAYGHMRLTEWVLGGVTRSMLTNNATCLLTAR